MRAVPELGLAAGDHVVLGASAPPLAASAGGDIVRCYRYTAGGVRRERYVYGWHEAVWERIREDGTLVPDDVRS